MSLLSDFSRFSCRALVEVPPQRDPRSVRNLKNKQYGQANNKHVFRAHISANVLGHDLQQICPPLNPQFENVSRTWPARVAQTPQRSVVVYTIRLLKQLKSRLGLQIDTLWCITFCLHICACVPLQSFSQWSLPHKKAVFHATSSLAAAKSCQAHAWCARL